MAIERTAMRDLRWTKRLHQALDAVRAIERRYVPGRDPSSRLDMAKIALADALLAAIATSARLDRVSTGAAPLRATLRPPGRRRARKA
jgi:hypothetical protein